MNAHPIPPMTDRLGIYWHQPSRDAILVDDTHAIMEQRTLQALPEYSSTMPSGVYPGKMWRCKGRDGRWWLCWFGVVEGRPDLCSNNVREVLLA